MSGGLPFHDYASARNTRQAVAGWRMALFAVLLVGFLWQGIVLQTHMHPYAAQAKGWASEGTVGQPANDRHSPTSPHDCPICQQIATAGTYVPASPAVLAGPAAIITWYTADRTYAAAHHQQAHHWRSRAPPLPPAF